LQLKNAGRLANKGQIAQPFLNVVLRTLSAWRLLMGEDMAGIEPKPRSGLVTAVAIVEFVVAGLALICGVIYGVFGLLVGGTGAVAQELSKQAAQADPATQAALAQAQAWATYFKWGGLLLLLAGILSIVGGVGVIQRRSWGMVLSLLVAVMFLAGAALLGMAHDFLSLGLYGATGLFILIGLLSKKGEFA
jgi:hypothetical protein